MQTYKPIPFDPRAWLDDPALKKCSWAARGLWASLLGFMHYGKPRGYLSYTPEQIVKRLGAKPRQYTRMLAELERHGVFSRTDAGTIYSRRMVREERTADKSKQELREAFDELVDHYPNATLVSLARNEFDRLCQDGVITTGNANALLEGLNRWKGSKQWRAEDGKYIPSLNKWLAERRWLDRPQQDDFSNIRRSRSGTDPLAIYDPNA